MAGMTRTIHPQSNFFWKPLAEACPDMTFPPTDPTDPPLALIMIDPDMETHMFVFNEEGRKKLVEALTGGVIMPNGVVPLQ